MMDPELLKPITKDANEAAQRLRAGLSSISSAQPIMKIPTLSDMSGIQAIMTTPTPCMPTFQSWIQEINEALKRASEMVNRAVAAFMRFFRNIARRLQRVGIIQRKVHAHKHRQSTRRMQVYTVRSL